MRWLLALGVPLAMLAAPAAAGSSYVLPDGTNRAPAMTLHCVTPGGSAVVCGTPANPLVVTAPAGAASSANQALQLGAEQASASAIGGVGDLAYAGGAGSMVSVLKALWAAASTGIPALPAGGLLTSRTLNVPAATSTLLFPANAGRRYLSFQVPLGNAVWINLVGGSAVPNGPDCAYFAAGSFYESGPFINRGAITVYTPVAVNFSAWEG